MFTNDAVDLYISSAVKINGGDVTSGIGGAGVKANNINIFGLEDAIIDELTVVGGDGNPGGYGIKADGYLYVSGNITINVTGGNGIKGYDGNCGDSDGDSGENGGSGYDGGIGINAGIVQIHTGIVNVAGGIGGQGGSGGCCNPNGIWDNTETGGNGGTGGTGGLGISANTIIVSGGTLTVNGGTGGKGGDRGGIYKGQSGGANGSYGTGGNGGSAVNDTCAIDDEQGLATFTAGTNGSAGTGSDCRDH